MIDVLWLSVLLWPPDQGARTAPSTAWSHNTRRRLSGLAGHDAVKWFWDQVRSYEFLSLAMQIEQLGGPPGFAPGPSGDVPPFVEEYFSMVPRDTASRFLAEWWRVADVDALLRSQRSEWEDILQDVASILRQVDVEGFQTAFFGRFPYRLVIAPVANVPFVGAQAVGVANTGETRAILLPYGDSRYSDHASDLVVVAQHEPSHVVVDLLQRMHPGVTAECLFVEEACSPKGRFASGYGDPALRFVETLIRASSYFFLQSTGMPEEADAFLASQIADGVSGITLFVRALQPWWQSRVRGCAAGLDSCFTQLPALLGRAASA